MKHNEYVILEVGSRIKITKGDFTGSIFFYARPVNKFIKDNNEGFLYCDKFIPRQDVEREEEE